MTYQYARGNPLRWIDGRGLSEGPLDDISDFAHDFIRDPLGTLASLQDVAPMLNELGVLNEISSAAFLTATDEGAVTDSAVGGICLSSLPGRLARVIPAKFANSATLAAAGDTDAFVTSASDIAGINTGLGLAERLAILDAEGNLIPGARAIIEFDTPIEGLASPVFRTNPGFIGYGQTAGGASEYVLPNLPINQLQNVTIRIVAP